MKTTNEQLLEWAITKIKTEYKEDVALLINNSPLKMEKDRGSGFDYFVPITERGNNLSETFIIDGVGYDLYPRSWQRIEDMAALKDDNTTCLGYAQIVYYRTEADRDRFLAMQEKLKENLKDKNLLFGRALEKLNIAMNLFQTMMFENSIGKVRMAAGFIADYLAVAVAFLNQTYFKYSQVEQLQELSNMEVPHDFPALYRAIIHADSVEELQNLCRLIIFATRKFMADRKPQQEEPAYDSDFKHLADWYQELCYTWRRIDHYCASGDVEKVFSWSCMLQEELNTVKQEFNLKEMDLLSSYHADDLSPLRDQAKRLQTYVVEQITTHGVQLNAFPSIEDFLQKKSS